MVQLGNVEDWLSLHVVEGQPLVVELTQAIARLLNERLVLDDSGNVVDCEISFEEVVGLVAVQDDKHGELPVVDESIADFMLLSSTVDPSDAHVAQWIVKPVSAVQLLDVGELEVESLVVFIKVLALGDVAPGVVKIQEPSLIVQNG